MSKLHMWNPHVKVAMNCFFTSNMGCCKAVVTLAALLTHAVQTFMIYKQFMATLTRAFHMCNFDIVCCAYVSVHLALCCWEAWQVSWPGL